MKKSALLHGHPVSVKLYNVAADWNPKSYGLGATPTPCSMEELRDLVRSGRRLRGFGEQTMQEARDLLYGLGMLTRLQAGLTCEVFKYDPKTRSATLVGEVEAKSITAAKREAWHRWPDLGPTTEHPAGLALATMFGRNPTLGVAEKTIRP